MKRKIVILGATSAIAMEAAKIWGSRGDELCLVARSDDKMSALAQDLKTRGAASVITIKSDLSDISAHPILLKSIDSQFGGFDTVLVAYGTLGHQKRCEQDFEEAYREINTNFLSVVSLLIPLSNYFEKRGDGSLAVITSVAGDRGRKSNYIYGTAKGAVSIFLQGLRNRLGKTGVSVIDIKPGFTDTPMTAELPKGPLYVSPRVIGQGIVKAVDSKRNTVYLPWFWEIIMLIIKHIPEFIFKKLSI
jgi:short-subunit dehydrogenase